MTITLLILTTIQQFFILALIAYFLYARVDKRDLPSIPRTRPQVRDLFVPDETNEVMKDWGSMVGDEDDPDFDTE